MGVLNVTPDSFSDGGAFASADDAVAHGCAMRDAGADIIDVGGESTRPGARSVAADEELARVLPVVAALAGEGVVVSIDTSKPAVAGPCIDAGAEIVNDVTGLRADGMAALCADRGVGVVVMHMQGSPRTMQDDPAYTDVVAEVRSFLLERAETAEAAGIASDRIAIDPGIGFGKTTAHNLALLGGLDALVATGRPVVIGASRKRFLSEILGGRQPAARDVATAATVVTSVLSGGSVVRVHNVPMALDAARTADAIVRAGR